MSLHAIFAAPFFMDATLRFIRGAAQLPGVDLTLVSQDSAERLPDDIRRGLAGHWQVADALDPDQLAGAARELQRRCGTACSFFGPLEQLQVPLAIAREMLGIAGLAANAARNFRDKARMKTVLRQAGVPCARHALCGDRDAAFEFADIVGFPLVAKPPAGAGGKGTFRLDHPADLQTFFERYVPDSQRPPLLVEFVSGTVFSFDSLMCAYNLFCLSISSYMPSPMEVLEKPCFHW
jgi:phosphoribosylamine-glycine ligase